MWKLKGLENWKCEKSKNQWKTEKCDFRPLEGRNRPRDCDFRNLRVKLYRIPKFSSKSVPWGPLSWPFEGIHVYTHVIRNPPRVSHDAICFLNHGFQIRNHLTLHAPTQVSYSMYSPYFCLRIAVLSLCENCPEGVLNFYMPGNFRTRVHFE